MAWDDDADADDEPIPGELTPYQQAKQLDLPSAINKVCDTASTIKARLECDSNHALDAALAIVMHWGRPEEEEG